jgi:hypothetical protein
MTKTPAKESPSTRAWRSTDRPQAVRVGKYFLLSDFLYSETAVKKGIPNCPPLEGKEVEGLRGLCANILDPVAEKFGFLSITYGYSSPALHQAIYPYRKPGVHNCVGADGATLAAACDILVHSMADRPRELLHWIKDNCVYDRLILYPGSQIVCVAWSDKPRRHAKEWIFTESGTRSYINLE